MAASKHVVRTFESLGAMLDFVNGPCEVPNDERTSRREGDGRTTFTGTESWDAAMAITHRWDEGVARIDAMRVTIKAADRAPRNTIRRSVTPPGTVDIAGVISCDPDAGFLQRRRTMAVQRHRGKVIRLLVNTGCSWAVSAETVMRRGAAILALVDMLEARGFRADITGCAPIHSAANRGANRTMEHRWTVKRADQRVSLSALAFGLAHPSMHRRVVFAARECESAADRAYWQIQRNMGASTESLMKDEVIASGGIYLGKMGSRTQFDDDDSAREWVRSEVERIIEGR
jgi:hypothetical protein